MGSTKTAFVTGGTGFLGINLIEELVQRGWRVTALYRSTSDLDPLKPLDVELVEGDILDEDSLRRGMPHGVDAVFHVAGSINLWSRHNDEQTRINVKGTHSVVTVAREREAGRLLHTSSITAYGLHKGRIDESAEQRGAASAINYVSTKATAETIVRWGIDKGLDAVILNPANIVGPYDLRGWASMIRLVHQGKLPGVPPGSGSFCYSREVARAHVTAAETSLELVGGRNYLLGGIDARHKEFARAIGRVCGKSVPRFATPYPLLWLYARKETRRAGSRPPALTPEMARLASATLTCDSSRAERDLDYRGAQISLETMIEQSYRWLERTNRL